MKHKISFLFALFTIVTLQTMAQNADLNFTIYGGLSAPTFSYSVNSGPSVAPTIGSNNGFVVGMRFATVKEIGKNINLGGIGAINYQQAGATISNTGAANIKQTKLRFNYAEINTGLGIGIGPKIPSLLELQLGLAAGYVLNGQSKTLYTDGTDSTKALKFGDSKASGKSYRDFDFGLKMGLSFNISNFNIAAYYLYGFSDISIYDEVTIKNKGFHVTLGYTVNLKSK